MALPAGWRSIGDPIESGQAWVYRVIDTTGKRDGTYALKRLKNPSRRDRFAREVREMQRLRGDGVVAVPEVVEAVLDGDRPHFVMPWLDGGSLQDHIEAGRFGGDPGAAIGALVEIAQALDSIHERELAHRDVKPANVLFDEGRVILTDFGLCLEVGEPGLRLTEQREAIGSRLYIAPENEGGVNDEVDQRPADFYAFSKVLWAVLAGQDPPPREQQLTDPQRLQDVLQDPRFGALDPVQTELLAVDPRARLDDWAAVIEELHAFGRVLRGEAVVGDRQRPARRDDALRAVRRIRESPVLTDRRKQIESMERDSEWTRNLQTTIDAAARAVAQEELELPRFC